MANIFFLDRSISWHRVIFTKKTTHPTHTSVLLVSGSCAVLSNFQMDTVMKKRRLRNGWRGATSPLVLMRFWKIQVWSITSHFVQLFKMTCKRSEGLMVTL